MIENFIYIYVYKIYFKLSSTLKKRRLIIIWTNNNKKKKERKKRRTAKQGEKARRRCTFIRRPWILTDRSKSNLGKQQPDPFGERAGVGRSINVIALQKRSIQFHGPFNQLRLPCPPLPDLISTNSHCSNLRAEFIYAPTSRDLFENVKKRRKRKRWRKEKLFGRSERTSERERGGIRDLCFREKETKVSPGGNINGRLLASAVRSQENREIHYSRL